MFLKNFNKKFKILFLLYLSVTVITPHLASSERDVIIKMANLAAKNVLLGVKGKPLETPVLMSE